MKQILVGVLLAGVVSPAFAADEYYIVQNSTTKKCTIVSQKPTSTETVVVGDGKVYTTRTEAENAIKTVKVCTTQ